MLKLGSLESIPSNLKSHSCIDLRNQSFRVRRELEGSHSLPNHYLSSFEQCINSLSSSKRTRDRQTNQLTKDHHLGYRQTRYVAIDQSKGLVGIDDRDEFGCTLRRGGRCCERALRNRLGTGQRWEHRPLSVECC